VNKKNLATTASVLGTLVLGCGAASSDDRNSDPSLTSIGSITTAGGTDSAGTAGTDDPSATASMSMGSADETAASMDDGIKYDVNVEGYCQINGPGIHCDGNTSVECAPDGSPLGSENCDPDICVEGTGCVACLAGQYTCQGPNVLVCNDAANPPAWQLVEVCDPGSGEGCDAELGACAVLQPEGTNQPTGVYYQFADFVQGGTAFTGGYDVDSFENNIYVLGFNNVIDHYTVELLDSDMDGELEPNQHPDNPDATGPIEQRVLTYVTALPSFGTPSLSTSEIYALEDRIYIAGSVVTEHVFGGASQQVLTGPPFDSYMSHIGFDDVRGVWYASNENQRRVFQHDPLTNTWGIAFLYPELAGSHMDGLEVVTDPETSIPYVYVSDMTSDFIGQYRLDPELGWTQVNLFSYVGTTEIPVEGMGWGALYHFWATSGSSLYEIGGGDLAEFVEPPG
jgi:hypothetical protein